ncbi:MAG: ABC transporter ATP-binding protein [Micropruina sp.]|nr:ABC transporter ATP-binding protein [Micropruina sp.]
MSTHPHQVQGSAAARGVKPEPPAPEVRNATPGWVLWSSAALAWTAGLALAVLFVLLGRAVDLLGTGPVPVGDLVWMGVLVLIAGGANGVAAWLSQWAASQTERHLRQAVVSRVFRLGPTATSGRSGELLALATHAVERASQYRAAFLGPMLGALTTPLLVLAAMALLVDPVIAGWLGVLILLVPLAIGGFQRIVRPIGAAYRRSQARLTAGFLEAVQVLETLVYARAAVRVGARLAERGEQHRRNLMRLLAGNQLLIFVVDAAFSLSVVVAAAGLAVAGIGTGTLSLGEGISVVLMTVLVIGPVDVVGQFFYVGIAGRATQRQLSAHLRAPSETTGMPDPDGEPPAGSSGDALVLDGVTAAWPGGHPVFRDLSLSIAPGERVVLIGPSGVGKSTVSALLQAHLLPAAGHVLVDGLDTLTAPAAAVRARLAVVEQRPYLFLGSIADNLRLARAGDGSYSRSGDGSYSRSGADGRNRLPGSDPENGHASRDSESPDEAALWAALEVAGLSDEVRAMPDGLHTPVGERGRLLSGGQAQRLAIARAALRDAPILILDEPTSQVDLAAEAEILAALERLAAGRTVLMIAHRPGAILAADRVIELTATAGTDA